MARAGRLVAAGPAMAVSSPGRPAMAVLAATRRPHAQGPPMPRPRRLAALVLLALATPGMPPARAADDPRFARDFAEGLRDRGYYDLALDYLDGLRRDPGTPADLRESLDFQEARVLIEAARRDTDPEVGRERLERARGKIEAFVRDHAERPEATEALVALANLLYERGRTEVALAGEGKTPQDRENRLVSARSFFGNARDAFTKAVDRLSTKLNAYPKFLPAEDPRRAEREQVRDSLVRAELQREIVGYDEAQTEPAGSPRREELLTKALAAFTDLYNRYRSQVAGQTAHMWQGKCFEEQGKLGEAMGIYKELTDQGDPALLRIQRQVEYFKIIVLAKRKEYALAADECRRWLDVFRQDRRSYEALGVQLELAKNIIAQLPNASDAEKPRAIKAATDALAEVVRVVSPFKPEAMAILQKYRPNAALSAADVAKMDFDTAVAEAGQSVSVEDYSRAIALLRVAGQKVDASKELAKANRARLLLGYALFKAGRFAEAAVVDEHIARYDPTGESSAKAAEVALYSLLSVPAADPRGDRRADLDRAADLATFTLATWPDTEQGDTARLVLGEVAADRGKFADAVAAYDSVRPASTRKVEAQAASGSAHWRQSLARREAGDAKAADAEAASAVAQLRESLKGRKAANVAEADPGYVNTAVDLASIEVATDRPGDAVALLEPVVAKLGPTSKANPTAARAITALLRAHVAAGKVDQAMADMKALEAAGGAGNNATQLYYELGRLLEKEAETLRKRNDTARLARTEQAYGKFLKALVANKQGQTFQSLRWAADNLLKLGAVGDATRVYKDLVDYYSKDPEFLKTPNATNLILTTRIRQVSALRQVGQLNEAEAAINELIEQNRRLLDPQVEKGHILDAKAVAKVGTWADAAAYWKGLATKLGQMNPKPADYYDAWYHSALALQKQGKADQARATVATVMRLSPAVGTPEMKAKYQDLLKQLAK